MKNAELEIDMARGFDVVTGSTNRVVAHCATYKEALKKQRERRGRYIRYYMLTEQAKTTPDSAA